MTIDEFYEIKSGINNGPEYERLVVCRSTRSKIEETIDSCGGMNTEETHYAGARVIGKVFMHRPTGRTIYLVRRQ